MMTLLKADVVAGFTGTATTIAMPDMSRSHLELDQQKVQRLHDDATEGKGVGPSIKCKVAHSSNDAAHHHQHHRAGQGGLWPGPFPYRLQCKKTQDNTGWRLLKFN